ncbi:hypothetical protein Gpo141_00008530 [Globisporangium polare]
MGGKRGASLTTPGGAANAKKKKKRSASLANDEKLALCAYAAQHESLSQRELCVWAQRAFDLPCAPSQSTVSNVLKKRDALQNMVSSELALKRQRVVKHPELDRALANWALYAIQQSSQPVTGNLIKKKAAKFAALLYPNDSAGQSINFSNGWLVSFKERHGLNGLKKKAKDKELVERSLPDLQELTAMYHPRDVFNFDEFGLFYDLPPDRSAAEVAAAATTGAKRRRLAIAVCVNADGSEKIEPLFVGRVRQPKSFQGQSAQQLELRYESNQQACTNEMVFQKWLQQFNMQMRDEGRSVLLLLDTASSHVITGLTFDHVNVAFLPPHGADLLQPLNAGIVTAFKRRYRRLHLAHALERYEQGEKHIYAVDQLQAMTWSKQCWTEVSQETIIQSWQRTRLLGGDESMTAGIAAQQQLHRPKSREEQEIEDSIYKHIVWLSVANPMTMSELLNPQDENSVHAGVEDEDFVNCAIQRECESEQEFEGEQNEAANDDDDTEPQAKLTDEEKLEHVSQVLRFIDEHQCESATGKDLRKVQRALREKIAAQRRVGELVL